MTFKSNKTLSLGAQVIVSVLLAVVLLPTAAIAAAEVKTSVRIVCGQGFAPTTVQVVGAGRVARGRNSSKFNVPPGFGRAECLNKKGKIVATRNYFVSKGTYKVVFVPLY